MGEVCAEVRAARDRGRESASSRLVDDLPDDLLAQREIIGAQQPEDGGPEDHIVVPELADQLATGESAPATRERLGGGAPGEAAVPGDVGINEPARRAIGVHALAVRLQ